MGDKEDVVPKHVQIAQSFFPAGASDFFAIIGAEGKGVELISNSNSNSNSNTPVEKDETSVGLEILQYTVVYILRKFP